MSNGDDKEDDPLGDLLGDELGEWDAMFDSLHEGNEGGDLDFGPAPAEAAAPTPVDQDSQGEFDIDSTMGAPFEGAPEAGAVVDALAPGVSDSPFGDEEEDFGEIMGSEPQALGGLLGSGPVAAPVAPRKARPPTASEVRAARESIARVDPVGPEDAALDDFGSEVTGTMPMEAITRMAKSAEAFFDDEVPSGGDISLELDDDFYDGIQIGDSEPEAAAASDVDTDLLLELSEAPAAQAPPKKRTLAHVVRRAPSESESEVGDGMVMAEMPNIEAVPQQTQDEDLLSGIPMPVDSVAAAPPQKQTIGVAVDDALAGLLEEEAEEEETRPLSVAGSAPQPDVPGFGEVDLAGVVEAAVEDAVAMSTGTLLTGPLQEPDVEPDLPPEKFARSAPGPDLGSIQVPEDVGLAIEDRTDEYAQLLLLYERELALLDEVGPSTRLRIEAGRIAEALGDLELARVHFDEALKFDPNLVPANRALRRIERVLGNWDEVIHLLEHELKKASPAENDALALCRVGLLMAVGELDLARVAVGELLDANPTDARALLANLDLAFMDGREEEVESNLDSLADVLAEPALTAAALNLAAALAEKAGRSEKAMSLFGRALELKPGLGSAMGQRAAALQEKSADVAMQALEQARTQAHSSLRAALDWQRSEIFLQASSNEAAREVLVEALTAHPEDLLLRQQLVRASADDAESAARALQGLAALGTNDSWSSQLLGRAGRLSQGAEAKSMFEQAAEEAGNHFAARELRTAHVEAQEWSEVYQIDQAATPSALAAYRKSRSGQRAGRTSEALDSLLTYRDSEATGSIALEVASLDLAYELNEQQRLSQYQVPDSIGSAADLERAERLRSRALTRLAIANVADAEGLPRAAASWAGLAESPSHGDAAELAWQLASMSKNAELVEEHAPGARTHAGSAPARATQIGVESAGARLASSPGQGAELLHEQQATQPTRRGALLQWAFSLGAGDFAGAAACFEAEAATLESEDSATADRYLYRAAYLRAQHELEPSVASASLEKIVERRPQFAAASDLLTSVASLEAAQGIASSGQSAAPVFEHDDLSSEVRHAEALARSGEAGAAAELFATVREQHPDDALIIYGFERACWQAGASARLAEYGLSALRVAEERSDNIAKAKACEELARVDGELRGDYGSALMFLESAAFAAPERADLHRTLERELGNQGGERLDSESRWKTLGLLIDKLSPGLERAYYLVERARVATLLGRPEPDVVADYTQAFEDNSECRQALFYLEARASHVGASGELADLEGKVADYFAADPRARAAFLVRSGETMRSLDQPEMAMSRFKIAIETMPGYAPALFAWRDMALDHEMWAELAGACLLEATSVDSDRGRADLYHLAGVTLMDKAEEPDRAMDALRKVLVVDAMHVDAFVRLRQLFEEDERPDDLAQLLSMRLEVETDEGTLCEIHHALAEVLRDALNNAPDALTHLRAILELRPHDKKAIVGVSEIAWELSLWAEAADALIVQARVEADKPALIDVFNKLGTIYTEHLPEPKWALKSYRKVIGLDPTNKEALEKFAILSAENGDHQYALGACEQLIKQDPPVPEKIVHLHRMAKSFMDGFGDANKAERALRVALDLDLASDSAFDALIGFYMAQNSMRSARVHIDRVANAMRLRIKKNPTDLTAYRVLARAMDTRCKAGVPESRILARSAAGLAILLGDESPTIKALAQGKATGRARGLASDEHDELLFPSAAKGGVRALLDMLGERLAKHVGIDIRNHGVGRSDRRKGSDPIAEQVSAIATRMGLEEIEVYVSSQRPRVLAAEPTKPPSLIFGEALASADRASELRFLAGRSAKLVSAHLAIPLQLGVEKFGVLLVGVLRQFQTEFVPMGVDEEAVTAEQQRLRRLIPSGMLQELGPFALGLATSDFDHKVIWEALVEAGNRAGLLCAGDASAAVSALMRLKELSDPRKAMQDAEIATLARFACSEDHAALYRSLE